MEKLDKFLDLLVDIVNDDRKPWGEKRMAIIAKLDEDGEDTATAFKEFVSWFDGEVAP